MSAINLVSALMNAAAAGLNVYADIKRRERERRIEARRRQILAMIVACPANDIHTMMRLQRMLAFIEMPVTHVRVRHICGVKIVTRVTE
jgi:hypothetical protein